MLIGDQIRLKQILINLIKNALKFTHNGEITTHSSYDFSSQMLEISVKDTGVGMSDVVKRDIIEMFS